MHVKSMLLQTREKSMFHVTYRPFDATVPILIAGEDLQIEDKIRIEGG